jgi:hypothetical protein
MGMPRTPFLQNAFSTLAADHNEDKELIAERVANQFPALTYQSQLTASTAATTNQRNK